MNIIIPMAGRGSRLRPHTLTVPKPLIPLSGKTIVQRLVEDIVRVCGERVDEIAFIIGDFGCDTENELIKIAERLGSKGRIYYQKDPLGTAHAILCAKESLDGDCVIAFADTLFIADFKINKLEDGIIWVSQIDDPSSFGVVKLDEEGIITDFVEKPKNFISDLAIIGIYYFKDANYLKTELEYLLKNDIKDKGEYQLTTALENMKNKGSKFTIGKVVEWLDCGNKEATVYTNERVLDHNGGETHVNTNIKNSKIIQPSFIDEGVFIENSTIGPYASIGRGSKIINSQIKKSIIQKNTKINDSKLNNSMIGNEVSYNGNNIDQQVSIGDFSIIE